MDPCNTVMTYEFHLDEYNLAVSYVQALTGLTINLYLAWSSWDPFHNIYNKDLWVSLRWVSWAHMYIYIHEALL